MKISIAGIDKAEVLAALYNGSKAQGMGLMHYDAAPFTHQDAAAIIAHRDGKALENGIPGEALDFDYLLGRVIKMDLNENEIDPFLYDRDNGEGAAARVIEELRARHPQVA